MGTLKSKLAQYFFGSARRQKLRRKFEAKRVRAGNAHVVSYFHQADDPYSHLVAQILPSFAANYDIELKCYLVGEPEEGAAPELELLKGFARRDSSRLAKQYGLNFQNIGVQPRPGQITGAQNQLAQAIVQGDFIDKATEIGKALWAGQLKAASLDEKTKRAIGEGADLREKMGHYSSGMFHYGGEWYWGLDRLHYLEERLRSLGLVKADASILCPVQRLMTGNGQTSAVIDFYASLRSPYTYLAAQQVFDLARAYGATVNIKPVLPMVMRSLPVPTAKRLYIVKDVKRQADRLGIPFGLIADPVGKPVERGMAILFHAFEQGKGESFLTSFLKGVWSEGIDAGSDKGLAKLTERAGLNWQEAKASLINLNWQIQAEENREDMFAIGLWGVPSFQLGELAVWGEDRLWQIEQELQNLEN